MKIDIKNINIGSLISERVKENSIDILRICNFLKCEEKDVYEMYEAESLDTNTLLKWSKLLEYDFFRIYTQHLILFAPQSASRKVKKTSTLPQFRKNIYTKEIIDFLLELIDSKKKTKLQIINEYRIPKTTLYKWISKRGES